jgi:hypothetical protein
MRRFITFAVLLTLCAACQPNRPVGLSSVAYPQSLSRLQPAGDVPQLIETLRAGGAMVEPIGSATLDFLSVEGQIFTIDGERIQIYAYPDSASASADAARFSSDGAQINTDAGVLLVNWVATPHLYRADKLLVVYLGDNAATLARLDGVLGARFAGGANPYRVALAETR